MLKETKKQIKKEKKTGPKLIDLVFPNKKTNLFVIIILTLGILSGAIFLMVSTETDKSSVITQIQTFFQNVKNESIENGLALKNSLIINYVFVGSIWILGLSIIGVLANIFLTYIKGFLIGFSISSIFLTYGSKGFLATLFYTFPTQILNVIVVVTLSIYSIMFAGNLLKIIGSKKSNNRIILKKYLVILMGCIVISFISSLLEVYVFPNLLKLIISLYV